MEKERRKQIRNFKKLRGRIRSEIDEYNEKYKGIMVFHPEAAQLKNKIEKHIKKYYQIKSELRSMKNG